MILYRVYHGTRSKPLVNLFVQDARANTVIKGTFNVTFVMSVGSHIAISARYVVRVQLAVIPCSDICVINITYIWIIYPLLVLHYPLTHDCDWISAVCVFVLNVNMKFKWTYTHFFHEKLICIAFAAVKLLFSALSFLFPYQDLIMSACWCSTYYIIFKSMALMHLKVGNQVLQQMILNISKTQLNSDDLMM